MIGIFHRDVPSDNPHAPVWHWVRCVCGGALALAAGAGVFFIIGAAVLSVLPDRYDPWAIVAGGLGGTVLVLAAFVLPWRLAALALCTGCAMLLAVGALLMS